MLNKITNGHIGWQYDAKLTTMKESKTINIIGGGVCGLSAALALQNNGIDYKLYEANSEITYENVGLGISANIIHILKEWNIYDETKEIGAEILHLHFVDKKLNYIKSFPLKRPAISVNRKLFYKLLYDCLRKENINLNSAKLLSDFSKSDIVIAADGINSKVRKHIYPNLKLRNSNQVLWRGISEVALDEKYQNAYFDFVGNNLRFAIIHTGKDNYSWYIIKQKVEQESVSFDKEYLKSFFKDYHPIVNQIINASESIYYSELIDIDPNERKNLDWYFDNTILIGDAIHPTTPNMANGACLAIEDSYLLASLLGRKDLSIHEAFATFQSKRIQKVNRVVNQSYLMGKLMHTNNSIMEYFITKGISLTPKFIFDKIYSTILQETKVER